MCAIAGIYGERLDYVETMLRYMRRRGPDGTYIWRECGVALGMNRLSINDLSGGVQPFFNRDSTIVVVFNGEIYNHLEIRKLLGKEKFRGHCDGEVLPFLYEKYGTDCFKMLNGMFGIAIYDKRQHKIILARDGIGEKPLYYANVGGNFVFSTLIKPLKEFCKDLKYQISLNYVALWDFLTFGFIPEPKTTYQEIYALKKGHYLEFDCKKGSFFESCFWSESLEYFKAKKPYEDLVEYTREVVTRSVQQRLLSDVPVGCFLSGGLDSSIVASVASSVVENLKTFNIAFIEGNDPYCKFSNESAFAQLVAENIGTQHYEIQVTAKSFQEFLGEFISSIDQPFGAISGIGILMIARKARELGIKVMLSGDGADEMFLGYSWHPKLRFNDPRFITIEKPKGWHYYAFESEKRQIFNPDLFCGLESLHYFPKKDSKPLDFIDFDREFYLPYEMMVKLDRMCMGESVEGRACFVAPEIVSFCASLEYETLLQKGEKWLLKEAFAGKVPEVVLKRDKHGFNVPIDDWIKGEWLGLLRNVFCKESALHKFGILSANCEEYFMGLLKQYDRRVGNVAFYLIVLNLWLEKEVL